MRIEQIEELEKRFLVYEEMERSGKMTKEQLIGINLGRTIDRSIKAALLVMHIRNESNNEIVEAILKELKLIDENILKVTDLFKNG